MFFPVFQLEVHLTNSHLQELTVCQYDTNPTCHTGRTYLFCEECSEHVQGQDHQAQHPGF